MQVSPPDSTPTKRTRTKAKDTAALTAAPAKKSRSRKQPKSEVATPAADAAPAAAVQVLAFHPADPEITGMIATAAYFIAAQRNFAPGHELDDWLEAESRIRARYSTP